MRAEGRGQTAQPLASQVKTSAFLLPERCWRVLRRQQQDLSGFREGETISEDIPIIQVVCTMEIAMEVVKNGCILDVNVELTRLANE